jgi:hypothetical protein
MAVAMQGCPRCSRRTPVRFGTDGNGNLVQLVEPCACTRSGVAAPKRSAAGGPDDFTAEERERIARKTGICMDCPRPVEGKRGWALRCAEHKRTARRTRESEWRAAHPERVREKERNYRSKPGVREHINARERELHARRMETDPAYRERYRRRRQRETLFTNPNRAKYMETQARANADPARRERKRRRTRECNPYLRGARARAQAAA